MGQGLGGDPAANSPLTRRTGTESHLTSLELWLWSGFPRAIPHAPVAAAQKREGLLRKHKKQLCMCPAESSRKVQHSNPGRASSHSHKGERGSGNCPPSPQPMVTQLFPGGQEAVGDGSGVQGASAPVSKERSPSSECSLHLGDPPV